MKITLKEYLAAVVAIPCLIYTINFLGYLGYMFVVWEFIPYTINWDMTRLVFLASWVSVSILCLLE